MFVLHTNPDENTPSGTGVIVDTCVLVDIALSTRARHAQAVDLARCLRKHDIVIRAPMHAAFEFMCAIRQEVHQLGGRHSSWAAGTDDSERIDIWPVPIDAEFVATYPMQNLPDMRSGDFLFLAMASGDNQALVREDDDLFRKAQLAGVRVFRIATYLASECTR